MINQAIVLAAGLGMRMRPLTETCPKPLLEVHGKPLIIYNLENLARAGVKNIVIHVSYLADKIIDAIGDGKRWGLDLNIKYSLSEKPLESGGGIKFSLNYLKDPDKDFIVINSDILTDYNYSDLINLDLKTENIIGYLVLVKNPVENPNGDFGVLDNNMLIFNKDKSISNNLSNNIAASHKFPYTFSGIAVYNPEIIDNSNSSFSIINSIDQNIEKISANIYNGIWYDVGTIERYNYVNQLNLGLS